MSRAIGKTELLKMVNAKLLELNLIRLTPEHLDIIFDKIASIVVLDDKVAIRGFGTFNMKKAKARKGRNPATGAEIQIPARNSLAFKAAKEMRNL